MLYRIYSYMLNHKLKLDEFCEGDCVIIKLKNRPRGLEYYGVIYDMSDPKYIGLVGKPLAWAITGDLILDKMNFYRSSIEEIRLYTYDDARHARYKARHLLDNERLNLIIQSPPFQSPDP